MTTVTVRGLGHGGFYGDGHLVAIFRAALFAAGLMLIGLAFFGCDHETTAPDGQKHCVEFDRSTSHNGAPVMCRMVWCEHEVWDTSGDVHWTGGPSVMWCDAKEPVTPRAE